MAQGCVDVLPFALEPHLIFHVFAPLPPPCAPHPSFLLGADFAAYSSKHEVGILHGCMQGKSEKLSQEKKSGTSTHTHYKRGGGTQASSQDFYSVSINSHSFFFLDGRVPWSHAVI